MEVRDPIHGGIELDAAESRFIHQPFMRRLRNIRQVGFSYLAFPGANHTRYSHVIGVMHVAGMAFDQAYRDWTFTSPEVRRRFRAAVRLAALCHDLGHAPFSHCTEFAMPQVSKLSLDWYRFKPEDRKASHEDYTIAILAHTELGRFIDDNFPCMAQHVAALISEDVRVSDDFFRDGGLDHRRALSQIISSEIDADRLDYLVRDAYFSGAQYGTVDVRWILSNLNTHTADGQVWLALDSGGLYAFEDFLVARHHMFLQVYFHHRSVVYEEMLRRYVREAEGEWSIPADLDAYLFLDDVALEHHLRHADNRWARRLVEGREFRRVVERHGPTRQVSVEREAEMLKQSGLETIVTYSTGRLSRYALGRRGRDKATLFFREKLPGQKVSRVTTLREASSVFERYAHPHSIGRVYVAPEERPKAWEVLGIRPH